MQPFGPMCIWKSVSLFFAQPNDGLTNMKLVNHFSRWILFWWVVGTYVYCFRLLLKLSTLIQWWMKSIDRLSPGKITSYKFKPWYKLSKAKGWPTLTLYDSHCHSKHILPSKVISRGNAVSIVEKLTERWWNRVLTVKVFMDGIANHFRPKCTRLQDFSRTISYFFRGWPWYSGPLQKRPRCFDPDTNFCLIRQRSRVVFVSVLRNDHCLPCIIDITQCLIQLCMLIVTYSANDACDHLQCNLDCPFGFEMGSNDCPLCKCLDPCEVNSFLKPCEMFVFPMLSLCVVRAILLFYTSCSDPIKRNDRWVKCLHYIFLYAMLNRSEKLHAEPPINFFYLNIWRKKTASRFPIALKLCITI